MVEVLEFEKLGKGKIRISFDNHTSCRLYRAEAAQLQLEEHRILTAAEYEYLLKEVIGKRAKKRAMFLLEQMDRSEQKLREKLAQGEYPEECIEEAIAYVKHFHYLDDRRFAANYIRGHMDQLSRQQLSRKLMEKGISRTDIWAAMEEEYPGEEAGQMERRQILALLRKKHYDPDFCEEKERNRIYAYLLRRGFRSEDIQWAFRQQGQTDLTNLLDIIM